MTIQAQLITISQAEYDRLKRVEEAAGEVAWNERAGLPDDHLGELLDNLRAVLREDPQKPITSL